MMKPAGTIPSGFQSLDGELVVGGRTARSWAEELDTPCFLYDARMIEARIARLRAAMPTQVALHYAMKANPFFPLLKQMVGAVDGIDVASGGELAAALNAGALPSSVSFAGPGKRDGEIEAAILAGVTLNLESEREADRALSIGQRSGKRPRLAVRVNPPFDLKGSGLRMGGGAKPFGVDAERVPPLVRRLIAAGAEWRGFHVYAGTQSLDAAALIEAQAETVALAGRLAEEVGAAPPLVNLGGGFGLPYFAGDVPFDVETVGEALGRTLAAPPSALGGTSFALELGRWLVGEAGVYLTRIVDRKESGGQTFLIVDGGLHHQLAASGNFGTVVRRNYPIAIASGGTGAGEVVSVVGCLCTPLDRLADQVELPRAEPGDLVAIFMAGAYGASASPSAFLGHGPAAEALVRGPRA